MELNLKDERARTACRGKDEIVVDFVHEYLGRASVVDVSTVTSPQGLKLETHAGVIVINEELTEVLSGP